MSNGDSRLAIRTMKELIETTATDHPKRTFLRYRNETYTYAEIDERANAIANSLYSQGVRQGDFVCLFLYNRPEYLTTLFALAKIGAISAPIDTRFNGETLQHVLSETGAEVIVLDTNTRTDYEAIDNHLPNISTEYFIGESHAKFSYRPFDKLLEGDVSSSPTVEIDGSDPFSAIYIQQKASERPKGVMLPNFSYINTGWESAHTLFEFTRSDCIFTTLPLFTSYALQIGVVGSMLTGAEFAFEDQFRPTAFWDQVRTHEATVFLYLDRMLSVLYNHGDDAAASGNPLRLAIGHGYGFDTDEQLIERFEDRFDTSVLEGYGATETATVASFNRVDDQRGGSVGRPVAHAKIEIVDENDWPVPTGDTGEIVVRSCRPNSMFLGYHGSPEKTAKTCRNQLIHTNDIGYLDDDGYLHFVASKKNTINRGRAAGRISSLEVESIIDCHPAVQESAVIGVTDRTGEEDIKAVVVPREDETVTPVEICRHCEKQLAYLKVPRYIEIRDSFPRTPSGKIQKHKLCGSDTRSSIWDRESGYELSR
ncbi:AMP-binding protein [Natrinema halophilum]|uniref:AMP-binding protein n=1 Tax=Natrinema halophilum TaxID=1699371 RepID=UPI001F3F37B6|nr:AMP-binding protein [Natrinema halophilum]UHQ96202.1 AMP-binding protein [Natrinema halophilum]